MAGPSGVDASSPFFASVAAQAHVKNQTGHLRDDKKKIRPTSRTFDRVLSDALPADGPDEALPLKFRHLSPEAALEAMLDEVHAAGDKLKEKPLPDNIVAYKAAVKNFVRFVVDRTYAVTESTSGGSILKRKKFTQVQVIDQKLEQLAAGILSNQRSQLGLLERIEEINGMLVDLIS